MMRSARWLFLISALLAPSLAGAESAHHESLAHELAEEEIGHDLQGGHEELTFKGLLSSREFQGTLVNFGALVLLFAWVIRKKGKVVGITFGGNDETIMRTLMAKAGITEKDISIFSVRYDYTPFYQKRVDIWPVYRNSQAPILEKKLGDLGESVAYFNPAAHGVKFVANSVVTSNRMVESHPDVVEKFTKALLQGWEEALEPANEEQVLNTLKQFDKDTAADIMRKQLVITRSLIKPFKDTRIGAIDLEAWQQTEQIMLEQKQIAGPVAVEKVIRKPF